MTVGPIPRMTPVHPRWDEFAGDLAERLAFEADEDGVPVRWRCDHDHAHTAVVLRAMGFEERSVEASVAYFCEHGGFCDCEVLVNVPYPEFTVGRYGEDGEDAP